MWRRLITPTILASMLALALLGFACSGGDDEEPASATAAPSVTTVKPGEGTATPAEPTALPTPPGGAFKDCPDSSSLCAFAAYLNRKFEESDFAAVVGEATPRVVTCRADYGEGLDPDASVCRGKPAGTRVAAYDAGRTYSEGYRTTAEGLETLFRNYAANSDASVADDYGNGAFRMYSIGKRDCPDCRIRRTLVFSRIQKLDAGAGAGPRYARDALMLYVSSQGSAPEVWKIDFVLTGVQLGVDIPARLGGGGHPDGSLFAVWNPKDGVASAGKGPIWLGATVEVNAGGDCLNVRSDPSKSAAVVACLKDKETVVVAGPAQQAEGIKWWPVQPASGIDGPNRAGWASGEFLAPPVR